MSMAVAAVGLGAGGAMMGAFGARNSADSQKATMDYEAAVARNNQTIANYQADLAFENGAIAEQNQRLRTASIGGDQRAALAANGVDLGTGSATEVLATTKFMGERDALTIRDNAARQAWAYKNQAAGFGAEAAADSAASSAINPDLAFASSLIGGAAKVAGSWYKYNKAAS
jgi:hypothetical protein